MTSVSSRQPPVVAAALTAIPAAAAPRTYSLAELLADYSDYSGPCCIVVRDRVYDITHFITLHPGGVDIILEHAGRDATAAFEGKGHSADALRLLEQYYVGDLIQEDCLYTKFK